jgi:hypothetical protein
MAVSSAMLCALAFSGQIQVWHIAVGGIVAGIVWALELAVRRRMSGVRTRRGSGRRGSRSARKGARGDKLRPCVARPCASTNRTGGFTASGSRTRRHAFTHDGPRPSWVTRARLVAARPDPSRTARRRFPIGLDHWRRVPGARRRCRTGDDPD